MTPSSRCTPRIDNWDTFLKWYWVYWYNACNDDKNTPHSDTMESQWKDETFKRQVEVLSSYVEQGCPDEF